MTALTPGQWVFCGRYVGHRGWNVVDVAAADSDAPHLVVPLAEGIDHELCALMGVAGVAMCGVRRFRIGPAEKVWVTGQGLIGGFAAQAARAVGAHVTVTDVNEDRLERARTCGAHRVLDARDRLAARAALQEGGPYDCIVDGCGVPWLLDEIRDAELLARHGRIGLLAVRTDTTFWWPMLHRTRGSIEVSCHFGLDDLRVLLYFAQEGLIRLEPMVSHRVLIDDAPAIYALLRDRPSDMLGVIFDWS